MAKNRSRKERDAKAKAARRHPKNQTTDVIAIPPNQESNDLLDAANMTKTSDQAAADPTINTQSADDVVIITPETDEPPPIVSYDLDGSDGVADPADDPIEEAPRSKTNEELIAEELAATAEEKPPFEVSVSEFSLNVIRDGALNALSFVGSKLKAFNNAVVSGWIAFGAFVERRVDALYIWSNEQSQKLEAQMQRWFPKPDLLTKADFIDFIQALVEKEEEYVVHTMRLTKRIEMLEKAVQGTAPRTVSADKLDDLLDALRKGEKAKATTMYASLTGTTLKVAKSAVELAN